MYTLLHFQLLSSCPPWFNFQLNSAYCNLIYSLSAEIRIVFRHFKETQSLKPKDSSMRPFFIHKRVSSKLDPGHVLLQDHISHSFPVTWSHLQHPVFAPSWKTHKTPFSARTLSSPLSFSSSLTIRTNPHMSVLCCLALLDVAPPCVLLSLISRLLFLSLLEEEVRYIFFLKSLYRLTFWVPVLRHVLSIPSWCPLSSAPTCLLKTAQTTSAGFPLLS